MTFDVFCVDNHKIQVMKNCEDGLVVFLLQEIHKNDSIYLFLQERKLNCVCVSSSCWENDFSPFPQKDVLKTGDSFSGNGKEFLAFMLGKLMEILKEKYHFTFQKNLLSGYSLAGLFALYASTQTDFFCKIGCVSASLWYPDFLSYLKANPSKSKDIYLSLGDKESLCRNKLLKTSLNCQFQALDILNRQNKNVLFQLNEGGHFKDCQKRILLCLEALLKDSLYE